jgi:hypothetical protein
MYGYRERIRYEEYEEYGLGFAHDCISRASGERGKRRTRLLGITVRKELYIAWSQSIYQPLERSPCSGASQINERKQWKCMKTRLLGRRDVV